MAVATNSLESFIWGEGGAKKTPEQVARDRQMAALLMKGGADYSPVQHWAQGLARASQGIMGGLEDRWAGEAETAGRDGFQSRWDTVFGGGQGAPVQTAAVDPVAAALAATPQTASDATAVMAGAPTGGDFLSSLIGTESGGDWAAQNNEIGSGGQAGHFGRLQFGKARLQDAMNAGVIPAGMTPEQFMADPASQQAVEAWHFADIDQQAAKMGLNSYVGQNVGGATITPEAIRAMAHLGGIGGAQKFLESGGQYNPSDAYGTSLLDYATKHGGTGGGTQQVAQALVGGGSGQGGGSPSMQQLMSLASDPWASDAQKSIVQSLLGQQMEQQDPAYQLDMQLKQAQLAAANAPKGPEYGYTFAPDGTLIRTDKTAGTFEQMGQFAAQPEVDPNKAPTVQKVLLDDGSEMAVQWDGGSQQWVPINAPEGGGSLRPGKGMTENQSKLTLFQTLQTETQPVLLDLETQFDPSNIQDAAARSTPIAGNFFQSEEGQIYNTAASAWSEGALRIATGAAATPEEFQRTIRTYFAQPGDTPNTIAFKSKMRDMYSRAINNSMGRPGEGSLPLPSEFAAQFSTQEQQGAPSQSQPRVISQQDYQALPSGSPFIAADDPSRTVRIKP